MNVVIQMLYQCWVGGPRSERWPEYLEDRPIEGHGLYSFDQGLRLGILLATEAFYAETEL